jgi:hypothetical protein
VDGYWQGPTNKQAKKFQSGKNYEETKTMKI